MKTEDRSRSQTHIKNLETCLYVWAPASSSKDWALLPVRASAAFLLVHVRALLDAAVVVEEEEAFLNTDFDLSEVFPRIRSIRR